MCQRSKIVPVVFSANDKYAPYLGVTLYSLISHASKDREYRLHILTKDMNAHHKAKLKAMEQDNISIEFLDVTDRIKEFKIPTVKHLSEETAYRLLIDQIFPEYKKVLYLDCDIVVNQDVSLLYDENIEGVMLGASRANIMRNHLSYISEDLKVLPENYFNAGVLVINVEQFHKYGIGAKGLQMLVERRYLCQDQDVLNILCQGKVRFLDGRWNVEWEYLTENGKEMYVDEVRKGYEKNLCNPFIVHFTSPVKPWEFPEYQLAEYFWRYARKTDFYEEILKVNFKRKEEAWEFLFPWSSVKPNSNIILYGGGTVGKTYLEQIEKTKYCTILAVCDTYPKKVKGIKLPLIGPDEINQFSYDLIVIAIEKEEIANQIIAGLKERGIKENVICWVSPVEKLEETAFPFGGVI